MRIVVDINHPAHVHFYKNFVQEMKRHGHDVLITATEKDISLKLLDSYGLDYANLGSYGKNLWQKMINLPIIDIRMFNAVKRFNPDFFVGIGSIRTTHVSKLLHKKCINFDDTECSMEQKMFYLPFVDLVFTPSCFKRDLGKKQIRLDTHKELAYLGPGYFKPDPSVLDMVGLKEDERFIVVRFVSWKASHDVGQHGILNKYQFIKELEKYGRVLISSEAELEPELKQYGISLPSNKFHDLLYYASLYVGEGGTPASESALLGTHAIHISTTAKYCGVFDDLHSYGLLWTSEDAEETLKLAKQLLANKDLRKEGKEKLKKLLHDEIDITKFLVWFIENYPESYAKMKSDPDTQNMFRGYLS